MINLFKQTIAEKYIELSLRPEQLFIENSVTKEREAQLLQAGHYGTHIDVPLQTRIPISYMESRCIVFDVSAVQERDVQLSDFASADIHAQDFVIFKTNQIMRHFYGTDLYFHQHPQLGQEVIEFLIEKRVRIIGIDAAGVRRGKEHKVADELCERNGIYIVENLFNLDKLPLAHEATFAITILWFEIPGKTGLPCRVVAKLTQ